jgi:hypothetical protein
MVDIPLTYGVVLGRYWFSIIGGYIMNDGSCMMLPKRWNIDQSTTRTKKSTSFEKKGVEMM